ncbi:TetR family transcriptional regulator [Kitasatospora sp. NBC_01246]|uniref:TetR family transcriptional regulator n=1 Tax=Kitasatospora sp. NBC_01246 TaxID=2903570 RepID=UPI002E2F85F7|nr:TetR family transcriptional regulator [Kitasatospora sp. NBC_01246]
MSGKGEQRRAELLDAAEDLLVTAGGAELSMRAVAAAAGVRLGHLQYYFPTHAALVAAVLGRVLTRSAERLAPLLAPADPAATADPAGAGAAEAADRTAQALISALLAEQEDVRLVRLFAEVWAFAARDEAVADAVRAFYADYRARIAAFLADRRPDLPEAVVQGRAQVFLMLVEGASLFRSGLAGVREPAADEELLRTARSLLAP